MTFDQPKCYQQYRAAKYHGEFSKATRFLDRMAADCTMGRLIQIIEMIDDPKAKLARVATTVAVLQQCRDLTQFPNTEQMRTIMTRTFWNVVIWSLEAHWTFDQLYDYARRLYFPSDPIPQGMFRKMEKLRIRRLVDQIRKAAK